ncbi:MAG TPA: 50S ribosomal protein L25 [bacterium]|nr:50S ribosomal protein L25 [bacterium]HPL95493.1 50S ribosomal protein L25 [bacterium]
MTKVSLNLKAEKREITGKAVAKLRAENKIPAVVYGHNIDNINVMVNAVDLEKIMRQSSASDLIDLQVGDNPAVKVLVHEIDREPVRGQIRHVDFYQVNMKEKISTDVSLNFIGESPAVKDLSGVLIKTLDKIEIECLPGDLISNLEIDLSLLKQIGDSLRVKDLDVPEKITVLTEPETTVVLVEEQKVEVVEEKPTEVATGEQPAAEQNAENDEQTPANEKNNEA